MLYEVKYLQTIYDVALIVYGDSQYAVKLAIDNGLTITDSINGLFLEYNPEIKAKNVDRVKRFQYSTAISNNYLVKELQSNYDLAIQYNYGIDKYGQFLHDTGFLASQINNVGSNISVTKLKGIIGSNTIFATLYEAPINKDYLLLEDGFYLLQEDGSKIIL